MLRSNQEKIIYPAQSSFKVRRYKAARFEMPFHHHPEFELVYIIHGKGQRYIGETLNHFSDGDMILIGPNLAHIWMNPKKEQDRSDHDHVEAIVLQFSQELLSSFLNTPEFGLINQLLQRSQAGIHIRGSLRNTIHKQLKSLLRSKNVDRMILLIKLLDTLARANGLELINPLSSPVLEKGEDERLHAVHHFVQTCYMQSISSRDAAAVAHMESSAFCRFFKSRTQQTFMQFLIKVRIDHACQLLVEGKSSVTSIAYESGFNNLANFYRQFRKVIGSTPTEFQQLHV